MKPYVICHMMQSVQLHSCGIDLRRAIEILSSVFEINRLAVVGGGKISVNSNN